MPGPLCDHARPSERQVKSGTARRQDEVSGATASLVISSKTFAILEDIEEKIMLRIMVRLCMRFESIFHITTWILLI